MTTPDNPAFGTASEAFEGYYDTVRGYVREEVTRIDLLEHLPEDELSVLDVGGGAGRDAIWLARRGHRVRVVDPSVEQTVIATVHADMAGVTERVRIEQGDTEAILRADAEQYDVVLSHGVLMYVPDPEAHLNLLHDKVRPGGIVSILTKGKEGSLQRLRQAGKHDEADRLHQTGRMINNLGFDVLAVDEPEMSRLLGGAALRLTAWYGVRITSDADNRKIAEVPVDEMSNIIEDEIRFAAEPSMRAKGQMLHFICTREEQ
ncbi:MAG TPA: methyltransferase domain-containing protein [Candidatus Saccharimonadales bacterium]|nr:methyltransferase domain-containing protein [Candidatus Saccharimonadales bacterium]